MDMCIRQTRNEVLSGAIYDDRIGRHLDLISASNRHNAVSAHQHGAALFNTLVV